MLEVGNYGSAGGANKFIAKVGKVNWDIQDGLTGVTLRSSLKFVSTILLSHFVLPCSRRSWRMWAYLTVMMIYKR